MGKWIFGNLKRFKNLQPFEFSRQKSRTSISVANVANQTNIVGLKIELYPSVQLCNHKEAFFSVAFFNSILFAFSEFWLKKSSQKIAFFFQAYHAIHLDLEKYLRSQGISQVTIQPEFPNENDQMIDSDLKDCCYLNCHSDWCEPRKCCDGTKAQQINTVLIWKSIEL